MASASEDVGRIWEVFRLYSDRYQLDAAPLRSLESSIRRRRERLAALRRRAQFLETEQKSNDREIDALEREIHQSMRAGALLLADAIDEARMAADENWSPAPILGYRAWVIHEGAVRGVRRVWKVPVMEAGCLRGTAGVDVPHDIGRCGPPACGVYATKTLEQLRGAEFTPTSEGGVIGMVCLTGKVIEHETGYRARKAIVSAIAVQMGGQWSVTDSDGSIEGFFASPGDPVSDHAMTPTPDRTAAEHALRDWKEKMEWI